MKKIKQKILQILTKIKKLSKQDIMVISIILAIILGGSFIFKVILNGSPKQIYEVAIMVKDQNNSDKAEDMRTSMKIGDVLLVQKEGHIWSGIEKVSYLILKMELNEEQASKLTQSETEEIDRQKPTEEELEGLSKEQQEELKTSREEPDFKTIRPREYKIDMDEFEDFKAIDLLNVGQPYEDEVFGWSIVEKK